MTQRFPVAPLLAVAGCDKRQLAEAHGYSPTYFNRAIDRGGLHWITADRWACRIGRHPAEIWPEWFEIPEPTSARARARMYGRPDPKPCGTHAAYNRHHQAGETPCDACRAAEAEYKAARSRTTRRAA